MAKTYKMQPHSGANARLYVTAKGQFLRRKFGINNFRRKKRGETLRDISGKLAVAKGDARRLKKLLPYA